jgi:hypothetical protein
MQTRTWPTARRISFGAGGTRARPTSRVRDRDAHHVLAQMHDYGSATWQTDYSTLSTTPENSPRTPPFDGRKLTPLPAGLGRVPLGLEK